MRVASSPSPFHESHVQSTSYARPSVFRRTCTAAAMALALVSAAACDGDGTGSGGTQVVTIGGLFSLTGT